MRAATVTCLDDWYATLFDVNTDDLWQRLTTRSHTTLGDTRGYYVVWRGNGVHVSVPRAAGPANTRSLTTESISVMQSADFWHDFAAERGLQVVGPSTHCYLDADPGPVAGVGRVDTGALATLRGVVDDHDWVESGWDAGPTTTFGRYNGGTLVAASNLNEFGGQPRDIGVLVAPAWRGRGLSKEVGRHAASHAIRENGFARWGARKGNTASLGAARRLGFEEWCTQLWVR